MPVSFTCSQCGEAYDVDDDLAGKAIRCRVCRELGRVGAADEVDELQDVDEPKTQPGGAAEAEAGPGRLEPWFYRFAAGYAGAGMCAGVLAAACSALGIATLAVLDRRHEPAAVAVIVLASLAGFVAVAGGLVFAAAATLLLVDAGRSLRDVRRLLAEASERAERGERAWQQRRK